MKWQTVKTVLWSAIGGAVVWWIVLSAALGWMTAGSAEELAQERSEAAVLAALAPICVDRFNKDADKEQKLEALKKENSWTRDDFITKQGWAEMLGDGNTSSRVAEKCATLILAAKSS